MAKVKVSTGKKWINSFVAVISILVGMIAISFIEQLSDWFDLEAKVQYFEMVRQFLGVLIGLITYVSVMKNAKAVGHLTEVYDELVKVVWPEKDLVLKLTVGIVISVSIISSMFVLTDFLFQKILEQIY